MIFWLFDCFLPPQLDSLELTPKYLQVFVTIPSVLKSRSCLFQKLTCGETKPSPVTSYSQLHHSASFVSLEIPLVIVSFCHCPKCAQIVELFVSVVDLWWWSKTELLVLRAQCHQIVISRLTSLWSPFIILHRWGWWGWWFLWWWQSGWWWWWWWDCDLPIDIFLVIIYTGALSCQYREFISR